MDGQDEGSRRIYNQRDLTKRRTAIRKTPESSSCAVSKEEKKNSSSDEARGRTLTLPPTTPLTILLPNDLARPLTKSSQRLSSWARFSTKFIVLGLLGLGSLTSTVKDTPKPGPYTNLWIVIVIPFQCLLFLVIKITIFNVIYIQNIKCTLSRCACHRLSGGKGIGTETLRQRMRIHFDNILKVKSWDSSMVTFQ